MVTPAIDILVQSCEWFPSRFWVISENVFSPLLYYSYFGTLIPMLAIGLFVLWQDRRQLENRLLFLVSATFGLWVFSAMVVWATEFPTYTMFFWSILGLVEPFIYFFTFYFAYVFMFGRDLTLRQKIVFALPLLPTILLTSSDFMLLGYDLSNCDRNAFEGVATSYGYLIELLYTVSILGCSLVARRTADTAARRKIYLMTVGAVAFLLSFSLGNILEIFTENWYIGQYGLFGAPIFVALLAYLIIRFKALNARLFGAQALTLTLLLVIGSIVFARDMRDVYLILAPSIVLTTIVGWYLIRLTIREQHQRDRLRELAVNLRDANVRLHELDHLKSQFVSFASHQLKSPLTAIKWQAELLADDPKRSLPQDVKQGFADIKQSADNLLLMVNDFLDLRRIEEGRMEFAFQLIDGVPVIREAVERIRPLAERKKLSLVIESPEVPCMVKLDAGKLEQVVRNLVDNAIKYTDTGSVVVHIDCDDATLTVSVTDTGRGMDQAIIPKLFGQFVREPGTAKVIEGTGLGLYIAKRIIEAHHGRISVHSDGPGKGSAFSFSIPK